MIVKAERQCSAFSFCASYSFSKTNQLMRKILLLTIAMVCISFISNAQITKGSTFLGGSIFVNSYSNKDDSSPMNESKTSNWGIRPQFGKAISTNKIFGVFLNYNNSTSKNSSGTNNSKTTASTYGGGIFYRSYYPLSSRFFLFGEGSLGVNLGGEERATNKILNYKDDRTEVNLSLTPGISFAATKKLHLEAALNSLLFLSYHTTERKEYNLSGTVVRTSKWNQFNASANANGFSGLSIGLRWILPSKK